jgi:steroid delta-isomerase-like uncharacterized protein
MDHEATVRNYYAAWLRDDLEGVLALCTDDIVAVNVPIGPVTGKAAVREFFNKFAKGMSEKRYDIERIIASGDAAVVEGVENYVKNGKRVSLPYMSVFKFRGERISEWRDYFDMQTIYRQLGLPLDGSRPSRSTSSAA